MVSPPFHRTIQYIAVLCLFLATAVQAQEPVVEEPLGPVAEQIREQVEQWRGTHVKGDIAKTPGNAIANFYEQNKFAPAWTDPENVDQLLAALRHISTDGIDPEDYALIELQRRQATLDDPQTTPRQRAQFELLATDACLAALLHLHRGKVDPATLDPHWNFDLSFLDETQGFQQVHDALANGSLTILFARARPQNPIYDQLRTALATLRELAAQGGWPAFEEGPTLKPEAHDPRVPMLRQRLRMAAYPVGDDDDLYDPELEAALKQFQREHYLVEDGYLGKATVAALNVPVAARITQLRVNLERARWLLNEIRDEFVVVDIAGYQISYHKGGKLVWRSRVQVGKPYRRTPVFESQITYLTLNPTWTVPPTILRNDTLPKIRKNIGYLAANRMRVLDGQGHELSPTSVDWANPRGIILRQDAGPGNSLGRLVIRFPNNYAVYLHDTPHQHLFDSEQRAFSSGCIRVENPRELAELLLDDPTLWNRTKIDGAIDTGKTQTVMLREPVPLLLAYWTVDIREDGRIGYRADIYQRDPPVLAALDHQRTSPWLPAKLPSGSPSNSP